MCSNHGNLSLVEEFALLKNKTRINQKTAARLEEIGYLLTSMPADGSVSVQEKLWFAHCCTAKEVDFDAAIRLVNQVYPALLQATAGAKAGPAR